MTNLYNVDSPINRAERNNLNRTFDDILRRMGYLQGLQAQIDNLVVNGDSSVEAAQARVSYTGQTYQTLKERLDDENQELKTDIDSVVDEIDKIVVFSNDNLQDAIYNAMNEVFVDGTVYLTSQLNLPTGTKLIGTKKDGQKSKIRFDIDGTANAVKILGDDILIKDIEIEVNLTGNGTAHGGLGNNINIGDYQSYSPQEYKNIVIDGCKLTRVGPGKNWTANIGIFNKCHDIIIRDTEIIGGGNGICLHWSGDFDPLDPHFSDANTTWHPYNVLVENVTSSECKWDIFLSACYNFKAVNFKSSRSENTFYCAPGDFGYLKATTSQKSLIGTGIEIDGLLADNIINHVIECMATGARNGVPTFMDQFKITLKNITAKKGPATLANRNAIFLRQVQNVDIEELNAIGYNSAGQSAIYLHDASNVNINGIKTNSNIGITVLSSKNVKINGYFKGDKTSTSVGASIKGEKFNNSLSSPLSVNSTILNLSTATTRVLIPGDKFYFEDGTFVTVSDFVQTGATSIGIYPPFISKATSSPVYLLKPNQNVVINGSFEDFYNGVSVEGYSEVIDIVDSKFQNTQRNDINVNNTENVIVNVKSCFFENGGQNTSLNTYSIFHDSVGGEISNNVFRSANNNINVNMGANSSLLDVKNNVSFGVKTAGSMIFQGTQTAAASQLGRNNVNNNQNLGLGALAGGVGFNSVQNILTGTTAQRPTQNLVAGLQYKDSTLKKTITWYNNWYDETGTIV